MAAVAVEALALLAEREDRRRPGDGEVAGQVRKVFITKTLRERGIPRADVEDELLLKRAAHQLRGEEPT